MECDLAHFAVLVQQQARRTGIPRDIYAQPFRAARAFIEASPDVAEALLLERFMNALRGRVGAFREAEVFVLGGEALGIAICLLDRAMHGFDVAEAGAAL